MSGQDLAAEGNGPGGGPGQGLASAFALGRVANYHFDAGQEQGQPDGRSQNHGKDGRANQDEAAALEDESGNGGAGSLQAENTTEEIGKQPR